MTNMDNEYQTTKLKADTKKMIRQVAGITGETIDALIYRLVAKEYNAVMPKQPTKVKETRVGYEVKAGQ